MHLFEVWTTNDPSVGTGRVFVARLAAAIPQAFTVWQIVEALGFATLVADGKQVFIVFSFRDNTERAVFEGYQIPEVPEFSLLNIILVVNQDKVCEPKEENTATSPVEMPLVVEDTVGLMQTQLTAAEQAAARRFEPVMGALRLHRGRDASWRLWNHLVRRRAWDHRHTDEMSAWVLVEGTRIQSIPVTLFSSSHAARP